MLNDRAVVRENERINDEARALAVMLSLIAIEEARFGFEGWRMVHQSYIKGYRGGI